MKIVVLGTRGFPNVQGGVEKHCEQLFRRIASSGNNVTVFTRSHYIRDEEKLSEWRGIKFKHIWCPHSKSLEAIVHSFLGVLHARKLSPDLLHIHAIGPAIVVPFARLLGLKVVLTHHGPDYERQKWGKLAKIVLKIGEYCGVKFANQIIVISEVIRFGIEKKYGRFDSKLVYNGINRPIILPTGKTLKKYNLKSKKYLFTACRFVPEKGLHDLINAYAKLKNPQFKLVIAGDADHETEYSKSLKELAVKNNVVLTGNIFGDELAELFSNAGLFVLPSYYEGLPIALLEAISYKLPVLISDIPAHLEVKLNPERYFVCGDCEELSRKMESLFISGICEEEKKYFADLIENKYNWDRIAERTQQVYSDIIK